MTSPWMPHIDLTRCQSCGDCIANCPMQALQQHDETTVLMIDILLCSYCGACEEVCPTGAIELPFLIVNNTHREGQ